VGVEGGAGASSIALGLAGELSAYRGKKVFYISLEGFESPRLGTGGCMASLGDLSGFLFAFLRDGREGKGAQGRAVSAAPYVARDDYGVMRFPPSDGPNRLRELDGAELGRLLGAVASEMGADIVVADWGCAPADYAAEFIRLSAFTVLVARHGGVKTPLCGGPPFLSLADGFGVDRARLAVAVSRCPSGASGENGEADGGFGCAEGAGGTDGWGYAQGTGHPGDGGYPAGTDPAGDAGEAPGLGGGTPGADGPDGKGVACVTVSEDPYAFDRNEGRISISLATAFGSGVKRLADIALGADGETVAGGNMTDASFPDSESGFPRDVDTAFSGGMPFGDGDITFPKDMPPRDGDATFPENLFPGNRDATFPEGLFPGDGNAAANTKNRRIPQ
jgi:hypothetical protein